MPGPAVEVLARWRQRGVRVALVRFLDTGEVATYPLEALAPADGAAEVRIRRRPPRVRALRVPAIRG